MRALVLTVLLMACTVTGPEEAVQVQPTSAITAGYAQATACLGLAPLSVASIRYYLVPGDALRRSPHERVLAETYGRRIYVATPYADWSWLWAHEILHAFGVRHPSAQFAACRLEAWQHGGYQWE